MRSRRIAQEEVAEVARRRLERLSAELAEIRPPGPGIPPSPVPRDGSGEPSAATAPENEPATARALREPVATAPGRHARRPVGPVARAAGWCQDRLPPGLQGRIRLSGAHLAVVALFVLVGAAASLWWVSRADGGSQALPPVGAAPSALVTPEAADPAGAMATTAAAPAPPSGSTGPSATGASASATAAIVVDVAGKVRKPGIAELPAGSRVVDALHAAGGARRGVSLAALNLARVLTDGEQIVVGMRAPPGVAASAASTAGPTAGATGSPVPMVDINTAAQAELEELPGVGPVTAQAILDYRSENGSFTAVDQLLDVSGIGDATLAKIAPYVTL